MGVVVVLSHRRSSSWRKVGATLKNVADGVGNAFDQAVFQTKTTLHTLLHQRTNMNWITIGRYDERNNTRKSLADAWKHLFNSMSVSHQD